MELPKHERCVACSETAGLYASGICDGCAVDIERQEAIESARMDDEHAPTTGTIADSQYVAGILARWDRGQL